MRRKGRLPVEWEFTRACGGFEIAYMVPSWTLPYVERYWKETGDGHHTEIKAPKGLRALFRRLLDKRRRAPTAPQGRNSRARGAAAE